MDIFIIKEGTLKAGNVKGAKVMKTVVDYENERIEHYIQHETRDSDSDLVSLPYNFEALQLTEEEFDIWINQAIIDATRSRVFNHLNPE